MDQALASYAEALALEPDNVDANFNAAVTRLCMGDYRGGWKQYEHRWKRKDLAVQRDAYSQPIWDGEQDLNGKMVLLHAEQGLGDTIQFVRYAPLAAARGATVLLAVQPPLKILMCSVPGISGVFTDGETLPNFDLRCPLLSLPLAFGTELATVPANIPYLRPLEERLVKWRQRMPASGRLRVGLCWAGNGVHLNDRNRSIPLERFANLVSVPNLEFFSVQKDVNEAQAALLRDYGVIQLGQEFADFADTAAVVAMLDLLISVDTSVAHLAGAMGKAVALLLPFSPDFRWLLNRNDSPWYPTHAAVPADLDWRLERDDRAGPARACRCRSPSGEIGLIERADRLLERAADRERPAVLGIGRRGAPGRAIDLRRGLAGEIARQPAHDPFRDRMRGRQHDHVLLQHGAKRLLQRARSAAQRPGADCRRNFALAFSRSPAANSRPRKFRLGRLEGRRVADPAGMHQRRLLLHEPGELFRSMQRDRRSPVPLPRPS